MLGLSTMRKVMETASSQQRWVSMCLVVNMEMIEVRCNSNHEIDESEDRNQC